jgi:hypothetical protein
LFHCVESLPLALSLLAEIIVRSPIRLRADHSPCDNSNEAPQGEPVFRTNTQLTATVPGVDLCIVHRQQFLRSSPLGLSLQPLARILNQHHGHHVHFIHSLAVVHTRRRKNDLRYRLTRGAAENEHSTRGIESASIRFLFTARGSGWTGNYLF